MTHRLVLRRRRHWKLAMALVALFALVAAACGDDDDDAAATDTGDAVTSEDSGADEAGGAEFAAEEPAEEEFAPEPEAAGSFDADTAERTIAQDDDTDEEQAQTDGAGGDAGNPDGDSPLSPLATGRSIVFVASVEVTVDDVALATAQAKTQIAGLGGLLFGEDTDTGERDRTVLQFKVLPEDFQEALSRLEGLGKLESQRITADDVTERVVNLQSRISTSEVSVARLRELLIGASDLETVASLEGQLLQRETDLETLRGQLRTLQDQVSLATIFLTLSETAPPDIEAFAEFEVTFYDGSDDGQRCPGLEELVMDEGDQFTVCVQITNVGNVDLTDIEIRDDESLRLRPRDFTFVDGAADEPLAPGQQITAWASLDAPARGSARIRPSAVAVDESGEPLRVGTEFELIADYSVRFVENDALPGFVDALSGSWGFFKTLIGVAVLVAGAVVPFIWVPFVVWFLRGAWLRRQGRLYELDQTETRSQAPPPVPASLNDPADQEG